MMPSGKDAGLPPMSAPFLSRAEDGRTRIQHNVDSERLITHAERSAPELA